MKVTVITISDRAYQGSYKDTSGQVIIDLLTEAFPNSHLQKVIIPDESETLIKAFENAVDSDFIITTGGTGIGPRDITPEVTKNYCDYSLPGISETLRAESYKQTPLAMLSRAYSGIKDRTIIVNLPGSIRAVTLCTKILIPIMDHAIKMLNGEGH